MGPSLNTAATNVLSLQNVRKEYTAIEEGKQGTKEHATVQGPRYRGPVDVGAPQRDSIRS